jgi:ATP-dependent DNA helicase RecG
MNSKKENFLDQSVQYLKSVGPKRAEAFKKIGIETIRDILFFFPAKHLDRATILNSSRAYGYVLNGYDGELTILAKVVDKEKRVFGRKELMKVQFRDETGFFECVWFQGVKYFYSVFNEGEYFAVSGKPVLSKYGNLQFTHPDFDRITEDESLRLNTGKIIPFYRIPKELKEKNIGDFSLRKIVSYAVEKFAEDLEETLTQELISEHNLPGIVDAVKNYHFPESKEKLLSSLKRFKFEELFYLEILVALRKTNYRTKLSGNSLKINSKLIPNFLKTLPFNLTKAQLKVLNEIRKDMESPFPMNRLLQGDVGSGKTIVALIAMLIAVDSGFQAALMAPTEILADQHAKNIVKLLNPLKQMQGQTNQIRQVKVSLLLGGQTRSVKERNLQQIELQEADIIVGTHALFEEKVKFKKLGLVIIDEQHRFGVVQRGKLQNKSFSETETDTARTPDVIVMSATPIPRTLSMTLYGDLDVSTIDEMPKTRKPVKTILRDESKLPAIYKFIADKNKEGYQSFIVYPLVEESEKLELKAAETFYEELKKTYLKKLRIALIHGKMPWQQKEEVMQLFLAKEYDVLIATTVIEVGIDIPDANIILINDAHRFGLSQLHQLRGRIGRGKAEAYCILVTKKGFVPQVKHAFNDIDVSYMSSSQIEKYKTAIRLQSMVKHRDGFKIAEIDMKLRGPGDIFGTRQSGFPELKYADLITDTDIVMHAKYSAFKIIEEDPHLTSEKNIIIRQNLIRYYRSNLQYAKIA